MSVLSKPLETVISFPFLRRLPLLALLASTAFAQQTLVLNPPAGAAAKNKHVVLLSGDEEYRSEESLPMLAKILSQRHGFKCTVLFALDADGTINPDNQNSLPGAEALDNADLIIMGLRFRAWPDAQMKHFADAYLRGVPLIALRTSTHAFNFPAGSKWESYTWNTKSAPWPGGFGKNVLGETWVTHWGKHKVEATRGVIEPSARNDPLLRGVTNVFCNSDIYEAYPPADAKILLRGLILKGMNATDAPAEYRKPRATDKQEQLVNNPAMPVAWTRVHRNEAGKQNKILTTTLGAATDLENEDLRRLVVNGVYWGLGLDVPAKADVRLVDPYKPLMYGFRGYRVGLKPSDYALGKTVPGGGRHPPPAPKGKAKKQVNAIPGGTTSASSASAMARAEAGPPADRSLNSNHSTLNSGATGAGFQLSPGEHIALIGNGLADRMQHHGWLETMMLAQNPAHQLVVRNLAFPGDEVATRARSKDFGTPDDWLTKVQAGTVFAFFGYNESVAGPEGIPKFKEDLQKFLRETRARNYNGLGPPRITLFSPIATEKHPDPNIAFKPEVNANLAAYTQAMAEVARDQAGVTFVDLFTPTQQLFERSAGILPAAGNPRQDARAPFTMDGVHLTEAGEAKIADIAYTALFGAAAPTATTPEFEKLRAAVNAKNEMWHSRYRTVDGYNIYGDRSKIAYVSHPDAPKITNTHVMMEEMAQRDVMTANLERKAWALAAAQRSGAAASSGGTEAVPLPKTEMLPLPVVTNFGTNKPGPNIDGTYPFLDGDEAIEKMTLAPGLKANLFASEKQFPELAKAVQMNFDPAGRLWVAVWPSYPEVAPTAKVKDKILILEDTDKDGRADKCTTWLDGLNCPTGFQFFKDGILLMQAPNLWFVRDVDGKGQLVDRVLMGLDSADSHHTANSLIYEPGGAILLSDGVFHRSQVETVNGVVRNLDGALYRYEPLTHKFETYVAYAFANPHGRAFDYWGNDIITDATGNATYYGPAFSGKIDYPAKHPRLKQLWERPSRPSAGSTILTSTHFPEEYWGDYLNPNVIGFQGIFRVNIVDDGSGLKGTREPDIVQSKDFNFRPIDTATGPDGALYVCDWHNPLIGHLQSHLRDSNRDHEHGRIYRITCEGRPLAWQPKIAGEPIPALLELLKRKENQIRNLAKVELGKHDSAQVIAETKKWVAQLLAGGPAAARATDGAEAVPPAEVDRQHHLLEALWVHQWHNVVDLDLLARVLHSPVPEARAAAIRVLGYWRERVPNALAELRRLAADEHPRVRLQAVRAASFFPDVAATEVALAATKLPVDYYLDYVIGETLRQLRPQWRKSLGDGAPIAGGDPASLRYLLRTLSAAEVLKLPRTAEVSENILGRPAISEAARAEALAALAKHRNASPVSLLLAALESPAEIDWRGVGRLLLAQKPAELKPHRAALLQLGLNDTAEGRSYALAAVALADGSLDPLWAEATATPLTLQSLIGALHLLPNAELRATAYDRVMPLLAKPITDFEGPDHIIAATQRDAIRAAVSTRREPTAVFAALNALIERGSQVPAAAQGIRLLPRSAWTPELAGPAAKALVAWAGKTKTNQRTSRDYVETIQVADELAGLQPADEAAALRQSLSKLRVPVFIVRTVVEQMRYDIPRLVVPAGKAFEIIFENPDVMPHNLVVVERGARERVANEARLLTPENLDRQGRAWVGESREIVAATKLIETGQSETLRVKALNDEGVYEYVCTFPGHWTVMFGQLVVTKDVDAYLKEHPSPSGPNSAAPTKTAATHDHGSH